MCNIQNREEKSALFSSLKAPLENLSLVAEKYLC